MEDKMPALFAWLKSYEYHKWIQIVLNLESEEYKELNQLLEPTEFKECAGTSEMARRWGEDPQRFYFDEEQIMAGFEKAYGYTLGRLTAPWREYPKGTLVMVTFKGIDQTPPTVTIFIETE